MFGVWLLLTLNQDVSGPEWGVVYLIMAANGPQKLTYDDQRPVLEVELRATKTILAGQPIDAVTAISFVGGSDLNIPHPDLIRDEGDYTILPWETAIFEVSDWEVLVFLHNKPLLFNLDLPKQPKASTDWSGWVEPVPFQDNPLPADARDAAAVSVLACSVWAVGGGGTKIARIINP